MASMSLRSLRNIPQLTGRRCFSSDRTIKELDVLHLRQRGHKHAHWHLTKPLQPGARVKLSFGASVPASDLIGRRILDAVTDSKGRQVVLHEASLANYIVNRERFATPIYPHDANTIVSLLDLNLPRPGEEEDESDAQPFEIFEAGTGMGSLTVHIARALHAANPAMSSELRRGLATAGIHLRTSIDTDSDAAASPEQKLESGDEAPVENKTAEDIAADSSNESEPVPVPDNLTHLPLHLRPEARPLWESYRSSRRAVLHTLDNRRKHTGAAFKLVRDFRRALYLSNIDFHTGSIDDFITSRLSQTDGQPFLSRAVLDLPQSEDHADVVVRALRHNALLVLFKPSISQIASFQTWATETKQPLRLEKVIELPVSTRSEGSNDGSGGREWDVKMVTPKADGGPGRLVQVMRPKVGDRIAGGGFVAVFRRWPDGEVSKQGETESEEAEESSL